MDRRTFLVASAALPAIATMPRAASAQSFDPQPGRWRTYELVTRVDLQKPAGGARVWVPIPAVDAGWQRPLAVQWTGNGRTMEQITEKKYGASLLYAEWGDSEKSPWVEVANRFQTQDRLHDWNKPGAAAPESAAALALWTQPTDLIPTDGIVRKTADTIVKGKTSDVEKARALYDWVVANSYREPKTRGFSFDFPEELILGTGRTEGWDGDTRLYSIEFQVVPPSALPGIGPDCNLLS